MNSTCFNQIPKFRATGIIEFSLLFLVNSARGGWMIFHFSIVQIHFVFLLIQFHWTFSISYYILTNCVYYYGRGRVDDLSFFEYLSPFYFLSIEFHCTFSIPYKILHILFIIIVFRLGCDRPSGLLLFVPAVLFLRLRLFHCLISFLLFPCASVWENTRAWVPRFL